jgi:carbon storage regulator
MLVLSRKPGEEVIIASNIRVTVLAIRGNRVQLGFSAPVDAAIVRSELGTSAKRPLENGGATPLGSPVVFGQQRPRRSKQRACRLRAYRREGS